MTLQSTDTLRHRVTLNQAITKLSQLSKADYVQIVGTAQHNRNDTTIQEIQTYADKLQRAQEEKDLKAEQDAEAQRKRIEHPAFKFLEAYFRDKHHSTGGLKPYQQMNAEDTAILLNQLKPYKCYRADFQRFKSEAMAWLRNQMTDKKAMESTPANTPEQKKGFFSRLRR